MQALNDCSIVIENVSHTYSNGHQALDNVNLEIGVGLFGLLGSNGAGKSTLMRIICTLIEPKSGSVSLAGCDVVEERDKARTLFGYLPQEFGAWRGKSVEDALDTLAALSGLNDKKERKQKVEEVLASVGLTEVSARKVKQLSGGMLRRLGVAQALIHDPKVIIMDEPTVGLDPEERLRFRQLIAELSRERVVVLSTHIVSDLGASCSKIALIHSGKVEFVGTPGDLIENAKGCVFEISAEADLLQELEASEEFEIVARSFLDGKNLIRGVAKDDFSIDGAKLADNITLEEAHLAFSLAKGRKLEAPEIDV